MTTDSQLPQDEVSLADQLGSHAETWKVEQPAKPVASAQALTTGAVQSDIEAALKSSAVTDAQHISVAVHGNDVTLSGTVHDVHERNTATRSAWATPGVRNVVDMLTLAP